MAFLLDANVVSEARRPAADSNVRAWLASVPDAELYVSVLVIGGIRQGIERPRRRDRARVEVFEAWLSALLHDYGDRIIPPGPDPGRLEVAAAGQPGHCSLLSICLYNRELHAC